MTKVLTIMLAAALVTACSESPSLLSPLPPPAPPPPPPFRIDVSASTSSLVLGDSLEVRAIVTGADGSPFPLTTVGWTTSNVAIATVTATGPLTAEVRTLRAGSVSITATAESHSGQLALAVTAPTFPWLAFIWSHETGMMALTFPPGTGQSDARAINDLGQVVGSVFLWDVGHVVGHLHAFVWTLEGGMTDIGGPTGYVDSYATDINNSGQVVGGSIDASGHTRAFRWSPSEGMIALPMPSGTEGSYALGINARGDVVGERTGAAGQVPFRWSQEKGTEDLTLFGSDSYGGANAIADNGDVVGYSGGLDNYDDITRAVLWSANGTKQIIDACTGGFIYWDFSSSCHSSANAINNAGQIAGTSDSKGYPVAFRLTVGEIRQDIPGMAASPSVARAINETGQVVGSSELFLLQVGEVGHAFLWSPISGMTDLGALPGRQWSTASSINNRGQVVGSSY